LRAAYSSSLIAYLKGDISPDTDAVNGALAARDLALPPPLLVELLSVRDGDFRHFAHGCGLKLAL